MENLEKEKTPQEWEIGVKEELAQSDELQLLDLAQDIAIRLASELGQAKCELRSEEDIYEPEKDVIRLRIARMAVMLDVLQLRYGDCAAEEMMFLESIEECLQEK